MTGLVTGLAQDQFIEKKHHTYRLITINGPNVFESVNKHNWKLCRKTNQTRANAQPASTLFSIQG